MREHIIETNIDQLRPEVVLSHQSKWIDYSVKCVMQEVLKLPVEIQAPVYLEYISEIKAELESDKSSKK